MDGQGKIHKSGWKVEEKKCSVTRPRRGMEEWERGKDGAEETCS